MSNSQVCKKTLTLACSYDAIIYARIFGARAPGTHNLHLIEDADHNFTGVGSFGTVRGIMELTALFSARMKSLIASSSGGKQNVLDL